VSLSEADKRKSRSFSILVQRSQDVLMEIIRGRSGRFVKQEQWERSRLECRLGIPVHCLQSNGVIIHMTSRT